MPGAGAVHHITSRQYAVQHSTAIYWSWMVEVNGLLLDLRDMPRDVQEIAFAKGMIPYIPADRKDRS
jgi:hypothetical protein